MESCGISQGDSLGNAPLSRATGGGHGAVVKMLLEREDIDHNKPSRDGQTLLMLAACDGQE